MKKLLLYSSIGGSVDATGMVQFKKYLRGIPKTPKIRPPRTGTRKPTLPFPEKQHQPNIIDALSDDSSSAVTIEKIVEKIMLLTGSFSRLLCGLKIEQPRLAESAFSSTQIERLEDPS